MDFRNDVLTVHDNACALRCAQCHVQDGPFLRDVDLFTAEHRVDPLPQAGFLSELQKQLHGVVRDAVLRIVQEQAGRL